MTIIYEKEQLSEIIAAVQAGQTIAFPTDTVYGLGVISTDAQALERLKAAKGRPDSKPIPTMVASVEQLGPWPVWMSGPKRSLRHSCPAR